MRGKGIVSAFTTLVTGITPAYAGKRQNFITFEISQTDHPRLCGEKGSGGGTYSNCEGSPPPMRGKV